jgi:hypothetical protein
VSTGFLIGMTVAVAVLLGARLFLAVLPLRTLATPVSVTETILALAGLLGLVFHCGAMFFPALFDRIPLALTAIRQINQLGTVSIAWYVVAAALVLAGLRRQHPVAVVIVALALAAVGITMYDGGPLRAHLVAIYAAVVVLAGCGAFLILPPWRGTTGRSVHLN